MTSMNAVERPIPVRGEHTLCELMGCQSDLLDDDGFLLGALEQAATCAGAQWIAGYSHKFAPQGVTAVGLLAESHIAIHTWPTEQYASVDCYTCGPIAKSTLACNALAKALQAARVIRARVKRPLIMRTPAGVTMEVKSISLHCQSDSRPASGT